MVFDTRAPRDATAEPINDPILSRVGSARGSNANIPDIVLDNLIGSQASRTRQLVRWRVPSFGFIDMYINPQSLRMEESKIISKQRTKGGYVIQYWGEELMKVSIEGHTGSSGIEGINILRKVYRAEQESFRSVSQVLIDRLNAFSTANVLASFMDQGTRNSVGDLANQALKTVLGSGPNPPLLPTLGSLATSVELYYQGWVFKGFFENFSVTESVSNGVGIHSYSLSFTVLDRRGFRTNYMPWHRSPAVFDQGGNPTENSYKKSDSASTPLNFSGEEIL